MGVGVLVRGKGWRGGAGRSFLPGGVSWRNRHRGAERSRHRSSYPGEIVSESHQRSSGKRKERPGRFLLLFTFTEEQKRGFIAHCGTFIPDPVLLKGFLRMYRDAINKTQQWQKASCSCKLLCEYLKSVNGPLQIYFHAEFCI